MSRRSLLALLLLPLVAHAAPRARTVTVFAAASLVDVLPRVAAAWKKAGGGDVRFSFDASSRLAAQIEAGAPAELFVSADEAWMDTLAAAHAIDSKSRVDLLGNELVLVSPAKEALALAELASSKVRRIAVGGENVPAGRYARAALRALNLFDAVSPKLVNAVNVRQALALAASGEVDAAFVYSSDAQSEPAVKVDVRLPESSHPPIRYPAALVLHASPEAAAFLAFCQSAAATKLFEAAGFRSLAASD